VAQGRPDRSGKGVERVRILFVHQNLPGQFMHLVPALMARGHECLGLTVSTNKGTCNFPVERYDFTAPPPTKSAIPVGKTYVEMSDRGVACALAAARLRDGKGYHPDVIFGHSGWGETLFLREVWPKAKLLIYPEFFYHGTGFDAGFDAEISPPTLDNSIVARARSAHLGQAIMHADAALLPTRWQASSFPSVVQGLIEVAHEGINTQVIRPNPAASVTHNTTGTFMKAGDEVLTFVNRNLEPYRGYHIFMRALPAVMRARPECKVVIVGGDGVSYGGPPIEGGSWKKKLLDEVGAQLDLSRVFFVGQIPHNVFITLMQVSRVHVYLTYPFVLSWSLLEAMAAGAPVIGSRTPPVEEVVEDGVTGRLVDFFDVPGWSAAMIEALANPAATRPLAKRARGRVVAKYDLSVCLPQWINFVERHGPKAA
jgi:glycosyltransferase involved in cell wall biosynthesis